MPTVETPRFAYPFAVSDSSFAVVEQDSDDDLAASVEVIASTPVGSRLDEIEFGVPDLFFTQMPADLGADEIAEAVEEWDDRIDAETVASIDGLIERIALNWKERGS